MPSNLCTAHQGQRIAEENEQKKERAMAEPLGPGTTYGSYLINRVFEVILVSIFGLFVGNFTVMNKTCCVHLIMIT